MFARTRSGVRWGTLALVGLLTAATVAPLPALADDSLTPGTVATNTAGEVLLVRSAPGYDAASSWELAPGAQVTLSDYPVPAADGSLWYPVDGGFVPTWAMSNGAAPAPAATDQAAGATGYVDEYGNWVDTSGQAAAAQPQASGYLDANGNWVDTTGQVAPAAQTTGYVDQNGNWVDTTGQAAPATESTGYVDENGVWVDTTGQTAPAAETTGYYDQYGNWVDTSGQAVAADQAAGYYDQYGNWVDPAAVDPATQAATAPATGYLDQYGNWVDTSGQESATLVSSDVSGPSNTSTAPAAAPIGTAYVAGTNGDGAICRAGADWAMGELGVIPEGTAVEVTGGTVGEWQPVNCNGVSGYVHASFISWNPPATTATVQPTAEEPAEVSAYRRNRNNRRGNRNNNNNGATAGGSGQQIANFASGYLGYPYVYAGAGPSGFDCSGFTMYVVQNTLGMDISHSVPTQYSMGTPVSRNQLQPGDLVFFENTFQPGLSHVGIFIGGGQFIHAENESTGVVVSDLNSDYYSSHYYGAVRLA